MNLEEANFILNNLIISKPCINGYMCITEDQIDQAVYVINKELKKRELKIKQLEKELSRVNNQEIKDTITKYDQKLKEYFNINKNQLVIS